jgi:isoleucyl-tRNA synthetase
MEEGIKHIEYNQKNGAFDEGVDPSNERINSSNEELNDQNEETIISLKQLPNDELYFSHEVDYVKKWQNDGLYKKIIEKNVDNPEFFLMDGPPFVSGNLHPGHGAISAIKSTIFNYKSMKGYKCDFKLGYDCHGLPVENLVAKEHNLDTLDKIKEMGLDKFNKLCDDTITKYSQSWTPLFQRFGRLADFDDTYMTRDIKFMESCLWAFKELWKKDLVYKGNKVMAYSYGCQTPLSNFEASQNYQEKKTKSVYVLYEVDNKENKSSDTYYLIAWTTTPWTLPMNMALCVNGNVDYVAVTIDDSNKRYILAKNCIKNVFTEKQKVTVVQEYKGKDLLGLKYMTQFPYINNINNINGATNIKHIHTIVADNYVSDCEKVGTGIVHLAPAFGEDDFRVCYDNMIVNNVTVSKYCPIDNEGKFTDIIDDYKGILVFDSEEKIRIDLKKKGLLFKTELYSHNYPYCWRTDTPLIYRTTESYYIRVTAIKDRLIEINKTINWHPKEIGENRFHHWLSNAKDWAVSRFRFYGTPIPIWINENGETLCIGSIAELEELSGEKITNLHPEYVNKIIIKNSKGTFKRIPDIFDCWFESGVVPIGQIHYPFSSTSIDNKQYLSDLICEGMDQTRGWFYTLLVISCALFDRSPYKNVICTGMILDKDGKKFSKKLGNFIDLNESLNIYGADVMRAYFVGSPVVHADSLYFDNTFIDRIKKRFIPYINGVKFWIEHTLNYIKQNNVENLMIENIEDLQVTNIMDKWLIIRTNKLIMNVNEHMDKYQFGNAVNVLLEYANDLTNWYIKLNRDRLKGQESNSEWKMSIIVLYNVIMIYAKLWTPITPFLSEHIFQHLKVCSYKYKNVESILLTKYPEPIDIGIDEHTLSIMNDLQRICVMVRNLKDCTNVH